jgi:hypothetical protein
MYNKTISIKGVLIFLDKSMNENHSKNMFTVNRCCGHCTALTLLLIDGMVPENDIIIDDLTFGAISVVTIISDGYFMN